MKQDPKNIHSEAREARINPPGLNHIDYKVGDFPSFIRRMRTRMHAMTVLDEKGKPHRPLAQVDSRIKETQQAGKMDFGMALLDAWAVVCDVLSFYTDRIANEVYLPTSKEDRSVVELAHMVGYNPDPGLAATTYTAFQLSESANALKVTTALRGTRLESVPDTPDTQSKQFETQEDLEARQNWNQLTLHHQVTPRKTPVTTGAASLKLSGHGALPRVGELLVITGRAHRSDTSEPVLLDHLLTDVARKNDHILISWKNPPVMDPSHIMAVDLPMEDVKLIRFSRKSPLFGHNATLWEDLPEDARSRIAPPDGGIHLGSIGGSDWKRIGHTLPSAEVRCMAVHPRGHLFVSLVGLGIYRSSDQGRTWRSMNMTLTSLDILSLAFDVNGRVYAGSADGTVFRSGSLGENWSPVKGSHNQKKNPGLPETAVNAILPHVGNVPQPLYTSFLELIDIKSLLRLLNPKVYVLIISWFLNLLLNMGSRIFQTIFKSFGKVARRIRRDTGNPTVSRAETESALIFVGTEHGVFRSQGNGWKPVNKGLPRFDSETENANLSVRSLAVLGNRIFAGTDLGIFVSDDLGNNWKEASHGIEPDAKGNHALVSNLEAVQLPNGSTLLAAGASTGFYQSKDRGRSWQAINTGIPQGAEIRGLAVHRDPPTLLFAATDQGIFSMTMGASAWSSKNEKLRIKLFELERHWTPDIEYGLIPITLRAAFLNHGVRLSPHAVIQVNEARKLWTIIDRPENATYHLTRRGPRLLVEKRITDIKALTVGRDGSVIASTPPGSFRPNQWPGFWLKEGQIDLADKAPDLAPGSMIFLSQDDQTMLLTAKSVTSVTRSDFGETRTVTRIGVDSSDTLETFDLRRTELHLISEPLELHWPSTPTNQPISGDYVDVAPKVSDMPPGRTLIISGQRSRARLGPVGGVYTLKEGKPQRDGLAHHHINAIVKDSRARLFAATDQGLFKRTETGWIPFGLKDMSVSTLAVDHELDELYAGVSGENPGLYRLRKERWQPLPLTFELNALIISHKEGLIYAAAGENGVWYSDNHGDTWRPSNAGLRKTHLTCLIHITGRGLMAGTREHGVFFLPQGKERWQAINRGLNDLRINCISGNKTGTDFLIGTPKRIFQCSAPGNSWIPFTRGLGSAPITALLHIGKRRYAGASGEGLYIHRDDETGWRHHPMGVSNHISTLADGAGRDVWIGTQSFSVLRDPHDRSIQLAPKTLFIMENAVRLEQETFLQYLSEPFFQHNVNLDEKVVLKPLKDHAGWYLEDPSGNLVAIYREGTCYRVCIPTESLTVATTPRERNGMTLWSFERDNGLRLDLLAGQGELIIGPANTEDPAVGERRTLTLNRDDHSDYSRLIFNRPLQYMYDRHKVTLYGNVAAATQGKTVKEVLGHGDQLKTNQRFNLKFKPLTYVPGKNGPTPQLQVHVNPSDSHEGVPWSLTRSLYPGAPDRRQFMLWSTEESSQLIFGDGRSGAKLPTGYSNITATYRYGLGADGNVPANTITRMLGKPLGIKRVTNPLPAEGGADPETPDQIRQRAPITTRAIDRIVTLSDCEDLVKLYPGISKVAASSIQVGCQSVAHLTLVLEDGNLLDPESDYYFNLTKYINSKKATISGQIMLDGYEALRFNVQARIRIQPGKPKEKVLEQVEQILLKAYNIENRHFGQDLITAELVRIMNDAPGVLSAELQALYPEGSGPVLNDVIKVRPAQWDSGRKRTRPAQILVINDNGIFLE